MFWTSVSHWELQKLGHITFLKLKKYKNLSQLLIRSIIWNGKIVLNVHQSLGISKTWSDNVFEAKKGFFSLYNKSGAKMCSKFWNLQVIWVRKQNYNHKGRLRKPNWYSPRNFKPSYSISNRFWHNWWIIG